MKRILAALGIVGLLVGGALFLAPSAKAITVPYSQLPRIGFYNEAGLNVAAGAIITSAVYNLDKVSECTILAENSAGGSSRTLNADWMASDGTTVLYRQAVTVTNGTRQLLVISPLANTASLPSGVTAVPAQTGKKMQFTLTAAGAAVGSLVVICQ